MWPRAQEFGFPDEEAAFALQFGHGVGLSIWEKPIFSRLVSLDHPEEIKEGMVFALETFWPASDGWSAARIEEQLVVTADGCEVITRFPAEDLIIAGKPYFTAGGSLPLERDPQSNRNTELDSETQEATPRAAGELTQRTVRLSRRSYRCGQPPHRRHDSLIPGAAAQVAGELLADLLLVGLRSTAQERLGRHQEPGGAEAALQRMVLREGALQRRQLAVGAGEPFDGQQRAAIGLDGEHQAGANRFAIELNRAGATDAVLAPDVRPGQPRVMADEVREQSARLDIGLIAGPVDRDGDVHGRADSIARASSAVTSARR